MDDVTRRQAMKLAATAGAAVTGVAAVGGGQAVAQAGTDGHPTLVYLRSSDGSIYSFDGVRKFAIPGPMAAFMKKTFNPPQYDSTAIRMGGETEDQAEARWRDFIKAIPGG